MKMLALAFIALALCSCDKKPLKPRTTDQVSYGKELVQSYGCLSCHQIPGMVGNPADLGPSLAGWAHRKYIVGEIPNRHQELTRWLMKPHAVDPKTTMPNLGLTQQEASAIASFLASLKEEQP